MGRLFSFSVAMGIVIAVIMICYRGLEVYSINLYLSKKETNPNAIVTDKYVVGGRLTGYKVVLDLDGDLSTKDKQAYLVSSDVYNNTNIGD